MPAQSEMVEPVDSLYSQHTSNLDGGGGESDANGQGGVNAAASWWQRQLFVSETRLFGTWDGVFASVAVNIFGIIVFLRVAWIVGTAGVVGSIYLLILCTTLALITVLSAIGVIERTRLQGGSLYSLIAHVLGSRIGASVGLIYVLGQAVATSLVAAGFGESAARFLGSESQLTARLLALLALLSFGVLSQAGSTIVIRLQAVLVICLGAAIADILLGSLWTVDPAHGIDHFSSDRLRLNAEPHYEPFNCTSVGLDVRLPRQTFFALFGIFFANFLGVLAGVNMAGDLKDPQRSIPLGELSAVVASSTVCLLLILAFGAGVERAFLLCDSLVASRVALTRFVFLTGLFVSSLASILGSLLGTPRVLQGIAEEGIIPVLQPLAKGTGSNRHPAAAALALLGVSIVFVVIADLNTLAILSTLPFLITYATVNWAHVSLAMTADLDGFEQLEHGGSNGITDFPSTSGAPPISDLFPDDASRPILLDSQTESWYSTLTNRYISALGTAINLSLVFLIDFKFGVAHIGLLIALWLYIGRCCPQAQKGVSRFSITHMIQTVFSSLDQIGRSAMSTITTSTVPGVPPPASCQATTFNTTNPDYAERRPYHLSHSSTTAPNF